MTSLYLLCNARLPSPRAHPLQVVMMWKAFARAGRPAHLLYPFRFQREAHYKGFGRKFWEAYWELEWGPSTRLPNIDAAHLVDLFPPIAPLYARVQQASFSAAALAWLAFKADPGSLVWTREMLSLPLITRLNLKVFYEMHRYPGSLETQQLKWLGRCRGVIAITQLLADRLAASGYPKEKILVAPDAYDDQWVEKAPHRASARQSLGLGADEKIVVYAGHLYKWKGVDTLVEVARALPAVRFHLVGGMPEDATTLRWRVGAWPSNAILHGHRPYSEVASWLRAADLACVPNIPEGLSTESTSPLKLYEAMALGTPLLVSDLPSLREAVDESCALLLPPGDVEAWTQGIASLLADPTSAQARAIRARERAAEHTWVKRAQRILEFMSSNREGA
ncbi:MAG: glycosyltransferase [Planctomycetota bacterium]